jgi:hypothetical protein
MAAPRRLHIQSRHPSIQARRPHRRAAAAALSAVGDRHPKSDTYDGWSELGEKIPGYDEREARAAAVGSPVHAMIL